MSANGRLSPSARPKGELWHSYRQLLIHQPDQPS